ncbi:shikimate dehydrogenase [Aureimonas fodinaquatilis]|uniref:Shikimate dehydrogenase (NADP(+)) n=1 Tax=Aureimonas fodinaquatilis TaxID=2565783 RepID=A0A5B0DP93_9HYPH|nr:shikimate dehydrogenase [Aureimonas fodinaquatilis]KAA0968248.1 shikimate dehydrogenase [Aureimonas fodinaquatilis]
MTDMTQTGPRAFVTGWPIWHSRSPMIHQHWLQQFQIVGSYERVGVPPEEIGEFLTSFRDQGFAGGNVTIPHKEVAFAAVDRHDAAATAIGAVNTLWYEGDVLVGGNTDAYGFATNLDERLKGWREAEEALVLGAGGAARAVVHAVLEAGISRVRIVNRNAGRARSVADEFGSNVHGHGLEDETDLIGRADLLINTRPAFLRDDGEAEEAFDLTGLPDGALVTDIVYTPLETPILKAAREAGHKTADGLGMLLHQAVPGFEKWFGVSPVVDATLRSRLLADIERV